MTLVGFFYVMIFSVSFKLKISCLSNFQVLHKAVKDSTTKNVVYFCAQGAFMNRKKHRVNQKSKILAKMENPIKLLMSDLKNK